MAYAAWSVIAGEQPTTSKWNILGSNDASFNDGSGISWTNTPTLANGIITTKALTNPYKFYAYGNDNQSIDNTFSNICHFGTVVFDTGGNFSNSTYGFTAPVAGFYFFSWRVGNYPSLTIAVESGITVNGTTKARGEYGNASAANGSALMQLAANDVVKVIGYSQSTQTLSNSGTDQAVQYFAGFLVSQI